MRTRETVWIFVEEFESLENVFHSVAERGIVVEELHLGEIEGVVGGGIDGFIWLNNCMVAWLHGE